MPSDQFEALALSGVEDEDRVEEDTWHAAARACECCKGFVHGCKGTVCAELGICECSYDVAKSPKAAAAPKPASPKKPAAPPMSTADEAKMIVAAAQAAQAERNRAREAAKSMSADDLKAMIAAKLGGKR